MKETAPVTRYTDCSILTDVLTAEKLALDFLVATQPTTTNTFIALLRQTTGKVVFSGLGKSWHVAQLLAATFSSVQIPSYALHASEALHGDAGILQSTDTVVVVSKSGNGDELATLLRIAKEKGCRTALLTCDGGTLASHVEVVVILSLQREAGMYDMVPTSSIILMISFGHAVALQIAHENGFVPDHFAQVHPAGSLGAALRSNTEEK